MVVVAWAVVVAIGYHRVRLAVEGGFWSPLEAGHLLESAAFKRRTWV